MKSLSVCNFWGSVQYVLGVLFLPFPGGESHISFWFAKSGIWGNLCLMADLVITVVLNPKLCLGEYVSFLGATGQTTQGLRTWARFGSGGSESRLAQKSWGRGSFLALAANTDISADSLHFPSLGSLGGLGSKDLPSRNILSIRWVYLKGLRIL